jgi:hypothetical protein
MKQKGGRRRLLIAYFSHGSNVLGLNTVAIYDQKSDEFIIHSPDLTVSSIDT